MKLATAAPLLLILVSSALAMDLSQFPWIGREKVTTERAQVVEVVRWRQPVCMTAAEGVPSCLRSLRKFQTEYEQLRNSQKEAEDLKKLKSVLPVNENVDINILVSSKVVSSLPVEAIRSSETLEEFVPEIPWGSQATPELATDPENIRRVRHLSVGDEIPKQEQIYVTKVLSSPMTATLVAYDCVPDIGVPFCEGYQQVKPSRPSLTVSVNGQKVDQQGTVESVWGNPSDVQFASNGGQPLEKPKPHHGGVLIPAEEKWTTDDGFVSKDPFFEKPAREPITEHVKRPELTVEVNIDPAYEKQWRRPIPEQVNRPELAIGVSRDPSFNKPSRRPFTDQFHRPELPIEVSKDLSIERPSWKPFTEQFNRPELSIEVSKQVEGDRLEASRIPGSLWSTQANSTSIHEKKSNSSSVKEKKHGIFEAIKEFVNKTEETLLHKLPHHGHQALETTTTEDTSCLAALGNLCRPGNVFHQNKDTSTSSKLEFSGGLGSVAGSLQESARTQFTEVEEEPAFIEVEEKPSFMKILHKPANTPGLLNIFDRSKGNEYVELVEPSNEEGFFGDLLADPVRPAEPEYPLK